MNKQKVFDRFGNAYFVEEELSGERVLASRAVLNHAVDEDDRICDEPWLAPSPYLVVLPKADILSEMPEVFYPKQNQELLDKFQTEIDELIRIKGETQVEVSKLRNELYATNRDIADRVKRTPKHIQKQLGYVLGYIEGKTLLILYLEGSTFKISPFEELLKDGKQARMLSLFSTYSENGDHSHLKNFDWALHQYCDDSGSTYQAFVLSDEKEAGPKLVEYIEKRKSSCLHVGSSMLQSIKDLGVVLPDWAEEQLRVDTEQQNEAAEKRRQRDIEAVKAKAISLGLRIAE